MPSRHSKHERAIYTTHEKSKAKFMGTLSQRLGTESQLPFGYCPLTTTPIDDCVISPSGRLYSREAILEYLLNKTKELKHQTELYRQQEETNVAKKELELSDENEMKLIEFKDSLDGVSSLAKRKGLDNEVNVYHEKRKKIIDETSKEESIQNLRRVSPWITQFTPSAKESTTKEPLKRPPSPFSGNPLRSKDLIPLNLVRETEESTKGTAGSVRFICPISRKTITNQKVIFIKSTGAYMLDSTAQELACTDMRCPMTGKKFSPEDILQIVPAASGFAASGNVMASKYRPTV